MKFDAELARQILIDLEDQPANQSQFYADIVLETHSPEEISYHVKMLALDNLVEGKDTSAFGRFRWQVRSLTPQGHRFLDEIRDENCWEQLKRTLLAQGGILSIATIKAFITFKIKEQTGLDVPW